VKEKRLPLLLCAVVTALCLMLPFGVFAVWDAALLNGAHPIETAPEETGLDLDARLNYTACALYNCRHLLGLDTGDGIRTQMGAVYTDAPEETRFAMLQDTAKVLKEAGLLSRRFSPTDEPQIWSWTAPKPENGLYPLSAVDEDNNVLTVVFTETGAPVYFRYSVNSYLALPDDALLAVQEVMGIAEFDDWAEAKWAGRLPDFGKSAYSEKAQLYLTVNNNDGLTFTATSMTPQEYAQFK